MLTTTGPAPNILLMNQKQHVENLERRLARANAALSILKTNEINLRSHMLSSKFHNDTSIQVADVARWLDSGWAQVNEYLSEMPEQPNAWEVVKSFRSGSRVVVARYLDVSVADKESERRNFKRHRSELERGVWFEVRLAKKL